MFNFILKILVKRNLKLRSQGKLPDELYWADALLMKRGIFLA